MGAQDTRDKQGTPLQGGAPHVRRGGNNAK